MLFIVLPWMAAMPAAARGQFNPQQMAHVVTLTNQQTAARTGPYTASGGLDPSAADLPNRDAKPDSHSSAAPNPVEHVSIDNQQRVYPDVSLNAISPNTLKTFVTLIDLVRQKYVNPTSDETLFQDAMSGMLSKLDTHAEFLDANAYDNLRAFTDGQVGQVGIDAVYDERANSWVVTNVALNSPAARAGISEGDYIYQIDDTKLTADMAVNDVQQRLIGIAGSQVDLLVSNAGRRKHTITLQRNQTMHQGLSASKVGNVALIKLPVFQNNSRKQIVAALNQLKPPITGLVLDLRNNPGGVLTSAVDIAGLFMSNTTVVKIKDRHGITKVLTTPADAPYAHLSLLVLQNRYSASAAEVLASSLQTQHRAVVAGELSYGKGSVQSVIPLDDDQAVKLTVAHYLTADDKKIDGVGVYPDAKLIGKQSGWQDQAVTLLMRPAAHTSPSQAGRKPHFDNTPLTVQ